MAAVQSPVSDMLLTVKSREVQRGMLAEMRGDAAAAVRHFLAAAHLEIVLSSEYEEAGETELAVRSRISAASCLWRGRQKDQAQSMFDALGRDHPEQAAEIRSVIDELSR